ncbi:MAG: hypothetical protein RLZZ500_2325 [Bacteroidota bacterium]|jgi:hypothetical protein
MKKATVVIAFLLVSMINFAQETNTLIGKWMFKEPYEIEKFEAEELKMVNEMFKNLMLEITAKEITISLFGKSEKSEYVIPKDKPNVIQLTSTTGKSVEVEIIKKEEKQIVVKIGRAGPFVLVKA